MNNLKTVYIDACSFFNIKTDQYDDLILRWNESHRHYHNLTHLSFCLDQLNKIKVHISKESYFVMVMSFFYHDIIYDTNSKNNELQSAHFANEYLRLAGLNKTYRHSICHLIKNSTYKKESHHPLYHIFKDIDLLILSLDSNGYNEYQNNIRLEYCQYNDDDYQKGRISFIQSMLKHELIYSSSFFKDMNKIAFLNLNLELESYNNTPSFQNV